MKYKCFLGFFNLNYVFATDLTLFQNVYIESIYEVKGKEAVQFSFEGYEEELHLSKTAGLSIIFVEAKSKYLSDCLAYKLVPQNDLRYDHWLVFM